MTASCIITVRKRLTFSYIRQSNRSIQLIGSLTDIISALTRAERFFRINRDSANRIDHCRKSIKIDLYIVIHILLIQITQCSHRTINSIDSAMCQFITHLSTHRGLHVIITRRIQKQHLLSLWVNNSKNIDIASTGRKFQISGIRATDINNKRILCNILSRIRIIFYHS